jgi:hypothetical protein
VVIEFHDTWAETGGKFLTLGGVASLVLVGAALGRRRPVSGEVETTSS